MDATGDGGGLASADGTGNAGLASWVARKRGVDTSKRLCKAEAGGGKCHDDKCRSVHVSSFEPTGAPRPPPLRPLVPGSSSRLFARPLTFLSPLPCRALQRMSSPSTSLFASRLAAAAVAPTRPELPQVTHPHKTSAAPIPSTDELERRVRRPASAQRRARRSLALLDPLPLSYPPLRRIRRVLSSAQDTRPPRAAHRLGGGLLMSLVVAATVASQSRFPSCPRSRLLCSSGERRKRVCERLWLRCSMGGRGSATTGRAGSPTARETRRYVRQGCERACGDDGSARSESRDGAPAPRCGG